VLGWRPLPSYGTQPSSSLFLPFRFPPASLFGICIEHPRSRPSLSAQGSPFSINRHRNFSFPNFGLGEPTRSTEVPSTPRFLFLTVPPLPFFFTSVLLFFTRSRDFKVSIADTCWSFSTEQLPYLGCVYSHLSPHLSLCTRRSPLQLHICQVNSYIISISYGCSTCESPLPPFLFSLSDSSIPFVCRSAESLRP